MLYDINHDILCLGKGDLGILMVGGSYEFIIFNCEDIVSSVWVMWGGSMYFTFYAVIG